MTEENVVQLNASAKASEAEELQAELMKLKSYKEQYFAQSSMTEDQLFSPEETAKELSAVSSTNELAFTTEQEALIFATELLKLDENKDISHYKLIPNLSRKALFFALEPVLKENAGMSDLITPSEVLSRSVHMMSISAEINRLKGLLNSEYGMKEDK